MDARDARGGRRDDGDEEEEGGERAIWGIVDRARAEAIGSGLRVGDVRSRCGLCVCVRCIDGVCVCVCVDLFTGGFSYDHTFSVDTKTAGTVRGRALERAAA